MLSYTFNKREKALLLVLALILVGLAWYALVFQRTNSEIEALDTQIETVKTQAVVAKTQLEKLEGMKDAVEERRAAGIQPASIPNYDNMTSLMAELNNVLAGTDAYSISFDQIDKDSATGFVLRGVQIAFECGSYGQMESTVSALANGPYSCSVDSLDAVRRSASNTSAVAASVHIIYVERLA